MTIAAEPATAPAAEITIRSDIENSPEACTQPSATYEDENGIRYELESWSAVPVTIPAASRKLEKEVIYDQAEGVTVLPETIELTAQDRERGQTATAVCRLEEQEVIREEWQDGFVFSVTFHAYGAGYYRLADRLIPYNEEKPELEGCEDLLLELADIPPEDYRVTHVQWSGEAYEDAEGNQCRDAAAFGQKRIRDYRVRYSGTAVFPPREGWQTVASYRLPQAETAAEPSDSTRIAQPPQTDGPPQAEEQPAAATEKPPLTLWERITRTLMITIAVGAAVFFLGLLVLAAGTLHKKSRVKKEKETKKG